MRTTILALALSSVVGGCAVFDAIKPLLPAGFADTVQKIAVSLCSIEPAAETIANMLSANPLLTTAEAAARAFCASITASPSKSFAAARPPKGAVVTGTYRGTPIRGTVR